MGEEWERGGGGGVSGRQGTEVSHRVAARYDKESASSLHQQRCPDIVLLAARRCCPALAARSCGAAAAICSTGPTPSAVICPGARAGRAAGVCAA
eukprot:scaffold11400_cov134-Isochrysis_galbana.AAC.1